MPDNSSLNSINLWNRTKHCLSLSDFKKKKMVLEAAVKCTQNCRLDHFCCPITTTGADQQISVNLLLICLQVLNKIFLDLQARPVVQITWWWTTDTSAGLNNTTRLSARDYIETPILSNVMKIHLAFLQFSYVERALIGTLCLFSLLMRFKI